VVDKFWTVSSVNSDGTVEVITRTGKKHILPVNDPNMRKADLFRHLLNRKRFPVVKGSLR